MTEYSYAASYGITYDEYMEYDKYTLNQAIKGGMEKENRLFHLIRRIGFTASVQNFKKGLKEEKYYPLAIDKKIRKKDKMSKKDKAKMENIFRKRDKQKQRIKNG